MTGIFNKHVRLVVGSELTTMLQTDFAGGAAAVPDLLYALCDAQELQAAVQAQAWPAADARFAGAAALDAYAAPFAIACFTRRLRGAQGRLEQEFAAELIRNFAPWGSQFDHYLARLYANGEQALAAAPDARAYALGLKTKELGMSAPGQLPRRAFAAHAAIYDAKLQREVLDRIYDCFLHYYDQAVGRFGARNKEDVLASCWGAARQAAGRVLPRLRNPEFAAQQEWVALAPLSPPAGFTVSGNMFVPWLALRSNRRGRHPLPLEQVLVHPARLEPAAATGLRAFLRASALPSRVLDAGPAALKPLAA